MVPATLMLPMAAQRRSRLLEPQELAEAGPPEAVLIPLDLIDPSANNPRQGLQEIDELAASIKDFSLLQPVTLRRLGERYELIGGHRRWAAYLQLAEQEPQEPRWRAIPAVIRTMDDDRAYLALITSQVHNRNWKPKEEAAALERLAETYTLKQIGALVHRTESWASKRLRVYADAVLSGFVQSGRLAAGIAEELLLVEDARIRSALAQRAVDEAWSQDQARAEARALKLDKQLRHIARQARELLGILSTIDRTKLPRAAQDELWSLHLRIEFLATGKAPVFPTIAAAQAAARVNPEKPPRQRRTRLKID
jgi:ParB family chromosome partitioning protein